MLKPGVVSDVNLAGHVSKDMPVYERCGKWIESLNEAYSDVYSSEEQVGMNLFTDKPRTTAIATTTSDSAVFPAVYQSSMLYHDEVDPSLHQVYL